MAKYCSQCGTKLSFKNSFNVNKQPVCGSCLIDRIGSQRKTIRKEKVRTVDKKQKDEKIEKKQKSLGWVMITGCLVPSVSTGIIISGYDLKGLIPLIALAIYILLLTLLSGSIIWSIEKIMKSRHDYNLHKMHFASNVIAIIAVIVTILLALYLSQGDLITKINKFKEKLIFAVLILIVAYFSYVVLFIIDRIKFAWKQKKMKKMTSKKDIKINNKPRSSSSQKTTS